MTINFELHAHKQKKSVSLNSFLQFHFFDSHFDSYCSFLRYIDSRFVSLSVLLNQTIERIIHETLRGQGTVPSP